MIYLAGNNTRVWRLRESANLGWMMSPDGWRKPVRDGYQMPYALDNGLYHPFGQPAKPPSAIGHFYGLLAKAAEYHTPLFAVAPDVPYHGHDSLKRSIIHIGFMRELGYGGDIALAVQDGMSFDVIDDDRWGAVFIGGSTDWKWSTMEEWSQRGRQLGKWVHVARVNTQDRIRQCVDAGVDSADGTGIFRGDQHQLRSVLDALREVPMFAASGKDHYVKPIGGGA